MSAQGDVAVITAQSTCFRCGHQWESPWIDVAVAAPCPKCDPPVLIGRGPDRDDPRLVEILASIRRCLDEPRPPFVDVTPDLRPRVAELEAALRGVLAVVDGTGYMPPEHQRALWAARQAIGGGR